ncbi:hypothetical protein RFI_30384 [Reticulomyxa filosa]|uniref:Uncharacterized protein n=1 Tax=Reticulomyxa filosa TaxID=46433 RepID=X6LZH5_RETFI|nr:hypothetical protein RFI_30384 [Reticulomyxa filosa]|eukprot:ETO07009.1 hypothetical protein RFI_30384 [Reticulomyxa filosa]
MYSSDSLNIHAESLKFPDGGVMPKQETGATLFLEKFPEYNGKGVLVAILDGGCDPTAEGLTVTPDGKPKFLDIIDASGSGDVNTTSYKFFLQQDKLVSVICHSKKKKKKITDKRGPTPDENGTIIGLTGRKLRVSKKWKNPSDEYHIGVIPGYYFFNSLAKPRLEKERTKVFNELQAKALGKLRQEISGYEKDLNDSTKKLDKDEKRNLQDKINDLKIVVTEVEDNKAN